MSCALAWAMQKVWRARAMLRFALKSDKFLD